MLEWYDGICYSHYKTSLIDVITYHKSLFFCTCNKCKETLHYSSPNVTFEEKWINKSLCMQKEICLDVKVNPSKKVSLMSGIWGCVVAHWLKEFDFYFFGKKEWMNLAKAGRGGMGWFTKNSGDPKSEHVWWTQIRLEKWPIQEVCLFGG